MAVSNHCLIKTNCHCSNMESRISLEILLLCIYKRKKRHRNIKVSVICLGMKVSVYPFAIKIWLWYSFIGNANDYRGKEWGNPLFCIEQENFVSTCSSFTF